MNIPKYLIVHHTGGTNSNPLADTSHHTFEIVNAYHRQNPNINLGHPSSLGYYIGYHYFIEKSGRTIQGRADNDEGAHTKGKNDESIGICLAGNFDLTLPAKEQIDSLLKLLERLSALYKIPINNIVPHRKFSSKTCYGLNLSNDWAADLVREKYRSILDVLRAKVAELLKKFFR